MCPMARVPFSLASSSCPKYLRHKTHVLVLEKGRAGPVAGDDSRALLAAMLQSKQAIIGQDRRVRVAEHAEESAFMLRERIDLRFGNVDLVWRDHTQ